MIVWLAMKFLVAMRHFDERLPVVTWNRFIKINCASWAIGIHPGKEFDGPLINGHYSPDQVFAFASILGFGFIAIFVIEPNPSRPLKPLRATIHFGRITPRFKETVQFRH